MTKFDPNKPRAWRTFSYQDEVADLPPRLQFLSGGEEMALRFHVRHPLDSPYWEAIGRLETCRRIAARVWHVDEINEREYFRMASDVMNATHGLRSSWMSPS